MSNGTSIKRIFSQPSFLIAAAVLLVAAIGLNGATAALQLHFKKEAVPLRVKLDDLAGVPSTLGKWVQVSHDEPLDPLTLHTLGSDQFVFRDYVDSTRVKPEKIEEFQGKSTDARASMVMGIQQHDPHAVMRVAVVYYTGLVDTVAHIPDHCMVADGYQPSADPEIIKKELGTYVDGTPRKIEMRFINFEDQSPTQRVSKNVAYFFQVNGEYVNGPLAVRRKLQNLFERRGYYAKVEVSNTVGNQTEAADDMAGLLAELLPRVEQCLPDWKQVQAEPQK